MSADTSLLQSVSRLALFADLDEASLSALLPTLHEVSYDEGARVVGQDEIGVGLYVIVDGEVGVVIDDQELTTLSKGSFFGEISALLGEPTSADIMARTRLRCLYVPPEDVEGFLLANPPVMMRMLKTEARRVRTTDELRT